MQVTKIIMMRFDKQIFLLFLSLLIFSDHQKTKK